MSVWIELRHRKTGFYSWPCLAPTDTQLSVADSPHWCCSRRELQDRGLQSPDVKALSSLDAEQRHWGLLVTKMATEGLTMPLSVWDSLPPSYIHFLSILTCVSMCLFHRQYHLITCSLMIVSFWEPSTLLLVFSQYLKSPFPQGFLPSTFLFLFLSIFLFPSLIFNSTSPHILSP